jgi:hypothetical protein
MLYIEDDNSCSAAGIVLNDDHDMRILGIMNTDEGAGNFIKTQTICFYHIYGEVVLSRVVVIRFVPILINPYIKNK